MNREMRNQRIAAGGVRDQYQKMVNVPEQARLRNQPIEGGQDQSLWKSGMNLVTKWIEKRIVQESGTESVLGQNLWKTISILVRSWMREDMENLNIVTEDDLGQNQWMISVTQVEIWKEDTKETTVVEEDLDQYPLKVNITDIGKRNQTVKQNAGGTPDQVLPMGWTLYLKIQMKESREVLTMIIDVGVGLHQQKASIGREVSLHLGVWMMITQWVDGIQEQRHQKKDTPH